VLLVDADRVGRSMVARALLRSLFEVTVVDSPSDLDAALESGEPIDVVLVDAMHAHAQAVVEALVRTRPDVAVIARSADAIRTRALFAQLRVATFDVRSREAPAEELVDAVKRVTGE
jgi:DNA-binding NtrC family response regulator